MKHKDGWPFDRPITKQDAPDYQEAVENREVTTPPTSPRRTVANPTNGRPGGGAEPPIDLEADGDVTPWSDPPGTPPQGMPPPGTPRAGRSRRAAHRRHARRSRSARAARPRRPVARQRTPLADSSNSGGESASTTAPAPALPSREQRHPGRVHVVQGFSTPGEILFLLSFLVLFLQLNVLLRFRVQSKN